MTSPVCRWCSTVVGKSFSPMMVLENIDATPTSTASTAARPNRRAMKNPMPQKATELAMVTSMVSRNRLSSFCG